MCGRYCEVAFRKNKCKKDFNKWLYPMTQLRKSIDFASCSQLLAFVQYIHKEDVKEEFLYCNSLETTAKAQDVMNSISKSFLKSKVCNGKSFVMYVRMEPQQCLDVNLISK